MLLLTASRFLHLWVLTAQLLKVGLVTKLDMAENSTIALDMSGIKLLAAKMCPFVLSLNWFRAELL